MYTINRKESNQITRYIYIIINYITNLKGHVII